MFSIAIFALSTALPCGVEVGIVATSIKAGSKSESAPKASLSLSMSRVAAMAVARAQAWKVYMRSGVTCKVWRWWRSKKARDEQSVEGHLTVEGREGRGE